MNAFSKPCPEPGCGEVFMSSSSNPNTRCPKCRVRIEKQRDAEAHRNKWAAQKRAQWAIHQQQRPAIDPIEHADGWSWLHGERGERLLAIDAEEADDLLRSMGIVIKRNGRPVHEWYAELIQTAKLTHWAGRSCPESAFQLDHSATPLSTLESAVRRRGRL